MDLVVMMGTGMEMMIREIEMTLRLIRQLSFKPRKIRIRRGRRNHLEVAVMTEVMMEMEMVLMTVKRSSCND